jgi:hypothetical protein
MFDVFCDIILNSVMNKKDVLIIGNDTGLYNICEEIISLNNKINLTVIVDGEHIYNIDNSPKHTNYPTIYGKVIKIDPYKKEVTLSNGGLIAYEFLILTPEVSLPFAVNENISGIYPIYDREVIDNLKEILSLYKYILVVGMIDEELNKKLREYGKTFEVKEPNDIKEIKCFDGKITSVVLSDNRLIFTDAIIVNSYLRMKPKSLIDAGLSLDKFELLNVYYIDTYENTSNYQNLLSRLKPPLLYACPAKLKVIPECNYITNETDSCGYYNSQVCMIQNAKDVKENTIITRFIESNITGFLNEEICNLCELNNCKNDFHLCGLDNKEICIREFVEKTLKTLIYRYGLFSKRLKIDPSIFKVSNVLQTLKIGELKNLSKILIKQNNELLKYLFLKSTNLNTVNIDFNFGVFDKNKINVLYISNREYIDNKFFKYIKENNIFNLICMGCGGIETAVKFGFPILGSVLDEEFASLTGLLDGVIIDEGCMLAGFIKKIRELEIPLLLKCRSTKDIFSFLSSLNVRNRNDNHLTLSKSKAYIGLPDKNLSKLNVKGYVIIPGCSGSCLGEKFIDGIKEFLSNDYAIFASGCSLMNLANLGYLGASHSFSSSLKVFGIGSFYRIYELGENLKNSNLPVNIYLQGIIKHDAILDALTLKEHFGFKIITDNNKVNNYLNALYG